MKKYILIQNEGEIESNSFELIGASTKRGEKGKIGFFGSGLKYSIAYMMRNSIDFKIYSGESELTFSTVPEVLKDKTFDRICINGKPTSYTVTMGPTWTQEWFVLREIYCNALDESQCIVVKETESVSPIAGKTRIYIELTETLKSVVQEWDRYFSDEREPIFECADVYTSGVGSSDGSAAQLNRQAIKVYSKTGGVLYRRGINVSEGSKRLFDYELQFVDINEDRTAKGLGAMSYMYADLIAHFPDENYVKSVLRTGEDDDKSEEYNSLIWSSVDKKPSEKWVDFSRSNLLVVKEISARFSDQIRTSKKEVLYIPSSFARSIKKHLPEVQIMGMGNAIGDSYLTEVDKTSKMDFLLKEVVKALKEMGYEVFYDIYVAEFDDDSQIGAADLKEKKIYLAAKTFDMGRREIALTLIEENEHIRSGKEDESRAFQNHILSQWLTTMENQNGLFL